MADYDHAIELDSGSAEVYNNQANSHGNLHDYKQALEDIKKFKLLQKQI